MPKTRISTDMTGLLNYVAFTHDIREVKRDIWVKNKKQLENDSEHSYQLAMTSLFLIEQHKLKLDPYKSMAIGLVHDVLEVHAGDTSVFAHVDLLRSKKDREQIAIKKLKKQWPIMSLMHSLIKDYETQSSAESRFVYALDKLLPVLNGYLDNGRIWKDKNIQLEDIISVKKGKVDIDPVISDYYNQIIKLMREKQELFS